MEQTNEQQTLMDKIFSIANIRMVGVFLVVLVLSTIYGNITGNQTSWTDTASSVPGDVEDIADDVFEILSLMDTTANTIVSEVESVDTDNLISTIEALLDEESAGIISSISIESGDTVARIDVTSDDTGTTLDLNASNTVLADETGWTMTDSDVLYITVSEDITVMVAVSREQMREILRDSALREDLFAATDSGYIAVVTFDNTPVVQFNLDDVSTVQITSLQEQITDDAFYEEDDFYQIDADPVSNEASIIAIQTLDINGWQIIGSYPESEILRQNVIESASSLFDVSELGDSVSVVVEDIVNFLNEDIGWLFRGLRYPIEVAIDGFEWLLLVTPWWIVIFVTAMIAGLSGGRKVAYIATFSMFVIGLLGLWDLTMTTLAMLLTSMAFCVAVGIPVGIWSSRSDTANNIVRAILDAMQTIHPFVYLVPIVVLFGIGKVPGTIATIIFALPPMVRLTNLGIRQVPEDVIEAGKAFGSSDWQLLRNVQIPLALPSIMAGVNQTLMLSLSMVVIVALIAGGGLGQEIYSAIGRADTGRAVVAGIAVLLLAVTIDRISQGEEKEKNSE